MHISTTPVGALLAAFALCVATDSYASIPAPLSPPDGPIEAFVSPATLFPQSDATNFSKSYRPLKAFDSPNGREIGRIEISNLSCYATTSAIARCKEESQYSLVVGDPNGPFWHPGPPGEASATRSTPLRYDRWAFDIMGLRSYRQIKFIDGQAWAEVGAETLTKFWVVVSPKDIHFYEDLTFVVSSIEIWCTKPGVCAPASGAMRDDWKKSHDVILDDKACFGGGYEIEERVVIAGTPYYRVRRSGFGTEVQAKNLPKVGYVPTRTVDGAHTGYIYSRQHDYLSASCWGRRAAQK